MFSIFSIAVNGLNNAVARIANATSNMVNASSTQNIKSNLSESENISPTSTPVDTVDIAANLIAIDIAKTDVAANAAVIKANEKNLKTLLDIKT